jgi:hypothetical protein
MAAPTNAAKREKSSCQPGAVHTWALLRHAVMVWQCPLFGVDRKSPADGQTEVKAGAQQAVGPREVLGPDWEEKIKKGVNFCF